MKVKSEKDAPTPAPEEIGDHTFHPAHLLKLITVAADDAGEFVCDSCKERGGAGCARYTCEEACDFYLHTSCALGEELMPEHPLFKGCAFVLGLLEPPPPGEPRGPQV
ncbi:hypothetical protein E2562_012896 [Oryza meyeriana var. granulata]|uniref:DC1 domain-containing protein n=1 Tax=Oryza meyeriana var. granulata TaxID=110450 RepID=A0A6G1CFU2_9ORYZ|nr:hypothetical protein E2562_012896 [Oryza meyeriana var. granulata]